MGKNIIIRFLKSMRFKIGLLILVIGIVPCVIVQESFLKTYETRAVNVKTIEILNQAKILANTIVSENYLNTLYSDTIDAELSQLSNIYDGRIMLIDKSYHIVKDTYDLDRGKTIISKEVMQSFHGKEMTNYDGENRYIEMTLPLTTQVVSEDEEAEIVGVLLVSVSTDSIVYNLEYLNTHVIIVTLACAMAIFLISIVVSYHITNPLHKLQKSIEEIHMGTEYAKVSVHSCTELQDISEKINQATASMKTLNDSRQEFVSNVSHELKTPLTSMKVLADSLNGMEDAPIELYKEFMADIGNEVDRETKIINDLLTLVKMDKAVSDLNVSSVNINELLELTLKRLKPIAQKQNVELVLESFRPVTAEVDEVKLTQAVTNLVENAIKYNKPEGGYVHVSLNADHQYFYLKVEDSGIGIPKESQEFIYERFYRVDKSHSREIGGTGLGLAITRSAVLMHRGSIKVHSVEGEGTTFTVRIPLLYIA